MLNQINQKLLQVWDEVRQLPLRLLVLIGVGVVILLVIIGLLIPILLKLIAILVATVVILYIIIGIKESNDVLNNHK